MRRLQESMGKSARLRPAKPGPAAFPTVGEAYIMPSSPGSALCSLLEASRIRTQQGAG